MACPGAVGLTYVVCMIAGFTPLVNAEIFLLVLAVGLSPPCAPAVVLAAAVGQMTAKLCWYGAGSGLITLGQGRMRTRVEHTRAAAAQHPRLAAPVVLVSAVTGIPPFFFVSVASGAVRLGAARFLFIGLAGRAVRFGIVLAAPPLAREVVWGPA